MADIIIYTTPKVLEHKQGKVESYEGDWSADGTYYWEFKGRNLTEKIKVEDRVYFATKGKIRGYFIIEEIKFIGKTTVIDFHKDSWEDIKPIPTSPFQGFKYFKGGSV